MKIVTARRISQTFFFVLFVWFCVVSTLGDRFWQLRGWPVNWLLQLDPLVGLGLVLATHTLYAGLLWGLATLALTFLLGRFFCGWMCPLGALQQAVGYLSSRRFTMRRRIARNQPHRAQKIKYWVLIFLLAAAAADLFHFLVSGARDGELYFWVTLLAVLLGLGGLAAFHLVKPRRDALLLLSGAFLAGLIFAYLLPDKRWLAASLQTGLLDPIALIYRSFNLVLLPLIDKPVGWLSAAPRTYQGVGLIGGMFILMLLLSVWIPRFYCRFVCPTGALMGLLSRWSVWRIGKTKAQCTRCSLCDAHCEGACSPARTIQTHECVLCFNCRQQCPKQRIVYSVEASAAGELVSPDINRRQVLLAMASGLAVVPVLRLEGASGAAWNPDVIRPPGALAEADFLSRCIKCGQCMRICPTNVIHAAGFQAGWEGLWTPVLQFRSGTSGCLHTCVACSRICPTAALRPLSLDERRGRGRFRSQGPVRLGTAFVDRGRCLPWAMATPCIVCQENCPVSPKAIYTRTVVQTMRNSPFRLLRVDGLAVVLEAETPLPDKWASGDYQCRGDDLPARLITAVTGNTLVLAPQPSWEQALEPGAMMHVEIRLQQPFVDPHHCIGCGVCEHECPVQGRRAIRVSAENESRQRSHQLTV